MRATNRAPMLSVLAATMMLAATAGLGTARASTPVGYQFDGLAFYQFGNPNDLAGGPGASPDTGFVRITNNGSSTFTGQIGFNATTCGGGNSSDTFTETLQPGDHLSFSFSPESSNFGGFNGPCGAVQNGAQFFMTGTVSLGSSSEAVSLSIYDKDIHSGVSRISPCDVTNNDAYILQGGSPRGCDNGDAFETTQAPGPFAFVETAPPPEQPITASGTSIAGTEGIGFTGTVATFSDPDTTAVSTDYSATIDWGDGSPMDTGAIAGGAGSFSVSGAHTYAEEGNHTVVVTIIDVDTPTNTAVATSQATSSDATLVSSCAIRSVSPALFVGSVATVRDANPGAAASDFTATINWGDGSASAGNVSGPAGGVFTVSGSHTFSATGNRSISATIHDVGGSTTSVSGCSVLIFGSAPRGAFAIGNEKSAIGTSVTFWSAKWRKVNALTGGGSAPASFKGFALHPGAPACGIDWSTDPGNSTPPPPGPLPAFIAVIVTSSVSQSGSQISGNTVHVVVVRTNAGYAPSPGHQGSGTVVAQIC